MTRTRLQPTDRKRAILDAAVQAARTHGYDRMTRDQVAVQAACSPSLVSSYFSTMAKLRRAVMGQAISDGHASIVADGLACNDPRARRAPEALIEAARAQLAAR